MNDDIMYDIEDHGDEETVLLADEHRRLTSCTCEGEHAYPRASCVESQYLESSRLASGVPRFVEDPETILLAAEILRGGKEAE